MCKESNAIPRSPSKKLVFHHEQLHTLGCGSFIYPHGRSRLYNIRQRSRIVGYTSSSRNCLFPIKEETTSSYGYHRQSTLYRYKISLSKYRILQERRRYYNMGNPTKQQRKKKRPRRVQEDSQRRIQNAKRVKRVT